MCLMRSARRGSFWLTGSYDPDLKLVYWTTGSPYPYPEILRKSGDGAVLYTNSLLALDAETGAIKWFFQMQPRDNFDMDHQDNPILADVEIRGTQRKVVYTLGKTGISVGSGSGDGRASVEPAAGNPPEHLPEHRSRHRRHYYE